MTNGPDFIALQVPDLQEAARFWTGVVGLRRPDASPPAAVVFDTAPVPFAVREPLVDLEAVSSLGHGVSLWFAVPDVDALHERLLHADTEVTAPPSPGPFGRMLIFRDPVGYTITAHEAG